MPAFFLFRMASALLLLKLSTSRLSVEGFALFSQFMLFASLLNMVAIGGAQNGVIRQAAAAGTGEALARVRSAALAIWAASAPGLALVTAIASPAISHVLTGSSGHGPLVIVIAGLALAAGPGQIWCSILSGRKRVAASMVAQALGLATGTAAAAGLLLRGDPIAAIAGFAAGPLMTMAIAFRLAGRPGLRLAPVRAVETWQLLRYSLSFATTTGASAILLFGLRALYRAQFGTVALGYWLVANRISDMSTQLLGLFLIQVFVPHCAMIAGERKRRALVLRCWAAAAGAMAIAPLLFSLAPRLLVHLFLSDAFLPAISAIRLYMIGDLLRVWVSLAMGAAFARGRPGRYAAIEITTLATMAAITAGLIAAGDARAPMLGYAGAYGIGAIVVTLAWLVKPPLPAG